jgi:hypothetical protein
MSNFPVSLPNMESNIQIDMYRYRASQRRLVQCQSHSSGILITAYILLYPALIGQSHDRGWTSFAFLLIWLQIRRTKHVLIDNCSLDRKHTTSQNTSILQFNYVYRSWLTPSASRVRIITSSSTGTKFSITAPFRMSLCKTASIMILLSEATGLMNW